MRLSYKKIISVAFGDINEEDEINYVADKKIKNTSSIKIISIVYHIIVDIIREVKPSIVIFSAKKQDHLYKSRSTLYELIIQSAIKTTNYYCKMAEDNNGKYFILIDRSLNLSKSQIKEIESQMKDEPNTLFQKIMDLVKK